MRRSVMYAKSFTSAMPGSESLRSVHSGAYCAIRRRASSTSWSKSRSSRTRSVSGTSAHALEEEERVDEVEHRVVRAQAVVDLDDQLRVVVTRPGADVQHVDPRLVADERVADALRRETVQG